MSNKVPMRREVKKEVTPYIFSFKKLSYIYGELSHVHQFLLQEIKYSSTTSIDIMTNMLIYEPSTSNSSTHFWLAMGPQHPNAKTLVSLYPPWRVDLDL